MRQSYLIVKEIVILTQRFSSKTVSHHSRTVFWENSVLKGYFYGNVFVLGKPRLNMRKTFLPLSTMPAGCLSWLCTGFDISASVETTWQYGVALDHVYFWNETKHSSHSFTLLTKIIEKRNSKSSTFPYWFQIMILIQVS